MHCEKDMKLEQFFKKCPQHSVEGDVTVLHTHSKERGVSHNLIFSHNLYGDKSLGGAVVALGPGGWATMRDGQGQRKGERTPPLCFASSVRR